MNLLFLLKSLFFWEYIDLPSKYAVSNRHELHNIMYTYSAFDDLSNAIKGFSQIQVV